MITVFNMASGEATNVALTEPKIDASTVAAPHQEYMPQVALRLMTVAEAVEIERRSRR